MASETITRNDLKAILDEVLPVENHLIKKNWDLQVTGASGTGTLELPKSLSEYSAIIVLIAGANNVTRFCAVIPAYLFFIYHTAGQQVNGYINNQRVFVQLDYVTQYKFTVTNSLDGTYCDRSTIYMV